MSWIEEIPYEEAKGALKKLYDRVKGPNNNIDNVLSVHSLRPHSMLGHMTLYKNVLHNSNNSLPKWYLEALGVYTSYLNRCDYCVAHHYIGMKRLIDDDQRSLEIMQAVKKDQMDIAFSAKDLAGIQYARMLTLAHYDIKEDHIKALRQAGFSDGEILEINQVVSYFNYVNRMVVGLGVNTEGDIIGLSPNNSDDPNSWGHS
ncbi:MAG: peroxidase-related enzyme [Bacteroidia bacterium]|nr:peroxidase-related enzyme [Bacteroidia bacterium]